VKIKAFKVGDILYDTYSKDVGILISRMDNSDELYEHDFSMWVWEIYWIHENHQYYSESGLVNMVVSERLLHFGNVKK
jgi:hypothetical protein